MNFIGQHLCKFVFDLIKTLLILCMFLVSPVMTLVISTSNQPYVIFERFLPVKPSVPFLMICFNMENSSSSAINLKCTNSYMFILSITAKKFFF